jgi:hypothetical protein
MICACSAPAEEQIYKQQGEFPHVNKSVEIFTSIGDRDPGAAGRSI